MGIQWIVATGISIAVLVGGMIMRDRQVMKAIAEGDAELHHRINEVKDSYVRRDDLNGHMNTIEESVKAMRVEQRATNSRIDNLLGVISGTSKTP